MGLRRRAVVASRRAYSPAPPASFLSRQMGPLLSCLFPNPPHCVERVARNETGGDSALLFRVLKRAGGGEDGGEGFVRSLKHGVVGQPQEAEAEVVFQGLLPVPIAADDLRLLMDAAVHFNDQLFGGAVEVQAVRADKGLPPDAQATAAVGTYPLPERLFGRRRLPASLVGQPPLHLPVLLGFFPAPRFFG